MKEIVGFEGKYYIHIDGYIYSKISKKALATRINTNGYKSTTVRYKNMWKSFDIHRLIGLYYIENPLNKAEINHIDGNRQNNSILNLEWVTSSENNKHAHTLKTRKPSIGKKCDRIPINIKEEIVNSSLSCRQLAKIHDISIASVSRIKREF